MRLLLFVVLIILQSCFLAASEEVREQRRPWLGVRVMQLSEEVADVLHIKVRGALVARVEDDGPAKLAGMESGDVIIRFDGNDIKEPRDLARVVADTAIGEAIDVVLI